jgi:hypothetical protein
MCMARQMAFPHARFVPSVPTRCTPQLASLARPGPQRHGFLDVGQLPDDPRLRSQPLGLEFRRVSPSLTQSLDPSAGPLAGSRADFAYGGVTLYADGFHRLQLSTRFYFLPDQQLRLDSPSTPTTQRLPALTRDRFGLFPFR